MMLRIAEAPEWDTTNEGKTLTPFHAAEFCGCDLEMFLSFINDKSEIKHNKYNDNYEVVGVYLFEVLHETKFIT